MDTWAVDMMIGLLGDGIEVAADSSFSFSCPDVCVHHWNQCIWVINRLVPYLRNLHPRQECNRYSPHENIHLRAYTLNFRT